MRKIEFMATPFDTKSVELLERIGVNIYKVGSGDCDNLILLYKIMETKKPIIISLGMTNIDEITKINNFLKNNNYENKYIFMHCISTYPTPDTMVNISCIKTLNEKFGVPIGFSDHTIGITAGILSVAYGATCIEKHITLDNNMEGPDHKSSLNPENFTLYVKSIREAENMIGDGIKRCMECEIDTKNVARKKLIYKNNKKEGDIINFSDLEAIRPIEMGISPLYAENIVGKILNKDVAENSRITCFDFI